MIVKTCIYPKNNLGDSAFNKYLVNKLFNKNCSLISISKKTKYPNYMFSGSILASADDNTQVWGAGFLTNNDTLKSKPKIYQVRGYLTLNKLYDLGYRDVSIGDPALITEYLYNPSVEIKYDIGIVLHYKDSCFAEAFKNYKKKKIKIINICQPIEKFVNQIKECNFIISSSLHGIIVSQSYHLNVAWAKFNNLIGNDFKFQDYFSTVVMNLSKISPVSFKECKNLDDFFNKCYEFQKNNIFIVDGIKNLTYNNLKYRCQIS